MWSILVVKWQQVHISIYMFIHICKAKHVTTKAEEELFDIFIDTMRVKLVDEESRNVKRHSSRMGSFLPKSFMSI